MTAQDILTLSSAGTLTANLSASEAGKVTEKTPALLLLPHLLGSPDTTVEVTNKGGDTVGVVDALAMLRGLNEILTRNSGDSSWVEASVDASDFSASSVARAVEDADANLLEMLTSPDPENGHRMRLSLKVSHSDPSGVMRSLERYGYEVVSAGSSSTADYDKVRERLSELQLYLSI